MATRARPTASAEARPHGGLLGTIVAALGGMVWGSRKQADSNEDLRGLLNAGHQRNRPMLRWDVTSRTRRDAPPLNELRDRLAGWVREHLRDLHHATPRCRWRTAPLTPGSP